MEGEGERGWIIGFEITTLVFLPVPIRVSARGGGGKQGGKGFIGPKQDTY